MEYSANRKARTFIGPIKIACLSKQKKIFSVLGKRPIFSPGPAVEILFNTKFSFTVEGSL
jgi:hypothetical protein